MDPLKYHDFLSEEMILLNGGNTYLMMMRADLFKSN